jgi:hypothetical protein
MTQALPLAQLIAQASPARGPEQFANEHARVDDESHQLWLGLEEISRTSSSSSMPERQTRSSTSLPSRPITSRPVRRSLAVIGTNKPIGSLCHSICMVSLCTFLYN